jgi:hypothetical protein
MHSNRGAQYTSWLFGARLRTAGRLSSMGIVYEALHMAAENGGMITTPKPSGEAGTGRPSRLPASGGRPNR